MPESHDSPPVDGTGKSLMDETPLDSSGNSLLDRPLHQLTEDDISQLTREDFRRYLKEKGMRRPSWNKSQAIQQVIMLKKLLEPDPETGARRRPNYISGSSHCDETKESVLNVVQAPECKSKDAEISIASKKTTQHHTGDLNKPDPSEGISGGFAATKDESTQPSASSGSFLLHTFCLPSPKTIGTDIAAGQMTIFYGGKVNVYDDMTADKAQAIMDIASSPLEFTEQQLNHAKTLQPLPRLPRALSMNMHQNSADVTLPRLQLANMRVNSLMFGEENIMLLEGTPVEGPSCRKASLQRYLEKKKERFKSKRKRGLTACATLDMYFNHQVCNQISAIDPRSPTQTRSPSVTTRCNSPRNDSVQNVCISTGLSDKGLQVDLT